MESVAIIYIKTKPELIIFLKWYFDEGTLDGRHGSE